MPQFANSALLNSDSAPKVVSSDKISSLTSGSVSQNINENSSFSDFYRDAQHQFHAVKKTRETTEPVNTPASNTNKTTSASNTQTDDDTVASTLGQIELGKKLPHSADGEDEVTSDKNLVAELVSLSPEDQKALQALMAKMLAQLQNDANGENLKDGGDTAMSSVSIQQLAANLLAAVKQVNESAPETYASNADESDAASTSIVQLVANLLSAVKQANDSTSQSAVAAGDDAGSDITLSQLLLALGDETNSADTCEQKLPSLSDSLDSDNNDSVNDDDADKIAMLAAQLLASLLVTHAPQHHVEPTDGNEQLIAGDASKNANQALLQQLAQLLNGVDRKSDMTTDALTTAKPQDTFAQLSQLLQQQSPSPSAAVNLPASSENSAAVDNDNATSSALSSILKSLTQDVENNQDKPQKLEPEQISKALNALDNSVTKDTSASFAQQFQQAHSQTNNTSAPTHYQLSLRQANEQLQTQELVQRFAPAMKQQLLTMVKDGIQHAEIRLDPPELGSMTVKVQVRGDHTQVQFHVTQTQSRDLIEQAMPRLKDLLQQQGMNLADSQVSYGGSGQQSQGDLASDGGSASGGFTGNESDESSAEVAVQSLNLSDSLTSGIDYYA